MWLQANPLNPCSNLVFVLVSAQHGQGDDSGKEVRRQGPEASHGTGKPAQRRRLHFRRVGQDTFLLCYQKGPDFPQRVQQVLKRGLTAVPLSCWGRSASVLTQGEFCETVFTTRQCTETAPCQEIPKLSHWIRMDWPRNEAACASSLKLIACGYITKSHIPLFKGKIMYANAYWLRDVRLTTFWLLGWIVKSHMWNLQYMLLRASREIKYVYISVRIWVTCWQLLFKTVVLVSAVTPRMTSKVIPSQYRSLVVWIQTIF